MPREDVPYPTSAICSIRERIAELRDELDQLLKTINGVAGDANHEIKFISDNAALGIINDAAQHEIHLDLDVSQLPAALVDSVNGQIGTVVLDGDDLDGVTPGNSVNDDIAALQGADVTLQGNINAEATARANADSSLSTAINAALATIPGEVSSQIAADATIAQLVYEDGQNVKLTGPQNISGVKTVPTETTGTFSSQIANSSKVKNELDAYAPMLRTTGNQSSTGFKKINNTVTFHRRITGSNAYNMFKISFIASATFRIGYHGFTRYGSVIGTVTIATGASDVSTLTIDANKSPNSSDNDTYVYAKVSGGYILVAIGNNVSFNNFASITIEGCTHGAGVEDDIDISDINTSFDKTGAIGALIM